jgi:flagellar hook-associated protein 1 FlgK
MSLSTALSTAQRTLSNTASQTSVVSRNISNASNPDYSRREAVLSSTLHGASIVTTRRAQDETLFRYTMNGTANVSSQKTLLDGLENLKAIFGGNDYETAPATLIAKFRDTLSTYAAKPSETTLAESTVADANQLAAGLRTASASVQEIRTAADLEINNQVNKLNELLGGFKKVNEAVIRGTQTGRDISTELDERNKIMKEISQIVGITTVTREGNDVALYTSTGTTLFDTVARPVTFQPQSGYSAALAGNAVYIDGVPLAAGVGSSTTATGSLQAHIQVRDTYAPAVQRQLDEVARGLITAFAEKDRSAVPVLPDMPGLFTWTGGSIPAAGTLEPGIAATIMVNPALVTTAGGNPQLLRDGGINGAAYVANPTGGASFSGLLDGYVQGIDAPMAFDTAAGLGPSSSITTFAANSIGWLEQNRSEADYALENREAFIFRVTEAHSNAVGVSIDEELSMLLELEQSYKASTKLISAVDEMLRALLAAA